MKTEQLRSIRREEIEAYDENGDALDTAQYPVVIGGAPMEQ